MDQSRVELVALHQEVKYSFMDYAMSVIVSRALPDVRDGLKPVHRRILYAMSELGMDPDKPHKKSARLVGEVLGKYHPHGDQAVYDAMVRMAQEFTIRYPLVDGQGNFGSMDGDSAAAMRYTEARLSPFALEMLRDLDKDTVDFRPNFDETLQEPVVLPARCPNLLVNGSAGIAVGMATNIPPHNLGEVIDALVELIDRPEADIHDLQRFIKGPDFPTGGIILGKKGINGAYTTGRGILKIRGKVNIESLDGDKKRIVITEIPYQQNKAKLIEKIAELIREKKIDGITDLRDESDRKGVRIVIELRKGQNPHILLNQLYKFTPLQQTFGVIMLALVNGRPKVLNLKEVLVHYLEHQREVVTRRSRFELNRLKERAHIVEGLRIALKFLDRVIALIRGSATVEAARQGLMKEFGLTKEQAQAILEMRLQKLTALERDKLEEEYEELLKKIDYLEKLLSSEEVLLAVIKEELLAVKKKHADSRKTQIVPDEGEIDLEDLIADEQVVVTMTHQGYIKRQPVSTYRNQHRGGKGIAGLQIRESDFVEHFFICSTRQWLFFFSNLGRAYPLRVYELPERSRQSRGNAVVNFLPLAPGEYITAIIPLDEYQEGDNIIMVTQKGLVKKTPLNSFSPSRRSGVIAVSLREGDELIKVKLVRGKEEVILLTKQGYLIKFSEEEIRPSGRTSQGVKGISLRPGDSVTGMATTTEGDYLLIVLEQGYGKRVSLKEFRSQKRGGKGIKAISVTPESGPVANFRLAEEKNDIMIVTAKGQLIRQKVSRVNVMGRYARGVRLIKLEAGDRVVNMACLEKEQK
ncbi:MAG: DNA gyrase subunit A [Firmicutes bacterium]|nr:DNA gyrase subunit A [Bacillota bacterium]